MNTSRSERSERARSNGVGFDPPTVLSELGEPAKFTAGPVLSSNGLTLYFTRADNPSAPHLIYMARRADVGSPFGAPAPVPELNVATQVQALWLSDDACRLYIGHILEGTIYIHERSP